MFKNLIKFTLALSLILAFIQPSFIKIVQAEGKGISILEATDLGAKGKSNYAPQLNDGDGKTTTSAIQHTIAKFTGIFVMLAGVIAIFFIALNAFMLVTSAGDQTQVEKARNGLLWAILGLVAIILSYSAVRILVQIALSTDAPANLTGSGGA